MATLQAINGDTSLVGAGGIAITVAGARSSIDKDENLAGEEQPVTATTATAISSFPISNSMDVDTPTTPNPNANPKLKLNTNTNTNELELEFESVYLPATVLFNRGVRVALCDDMAAYLAINASAEDEDEEEDEEEEAGEGDGKEGKIADGDEETTETEQKPTWKSLKDQRAKSNGLNAMVVFKDLNLGLSPLSLHFFHFFQAQLINYS